MLSTVEVVASHSEKKIMPDSTINRVLMLRDYSSFERFYSNYKDVSLVETIRDGSPIGIFSNKEKTQYLLTYKYEGDIKNSYSCFEVGYWKDEKFDKLKSFKTNENGFITESGIRLGMTLDSLIFIKGQNYKITATNDSLLRYEINDIETSSFLKRYNLPDYFMEFKIKDNKIQRILFGFEYP